LVWVNQEKERLKMKMKIKQKLTAISAAFACCAGISGVAIGSEADGSASTQIMSSDAWQQAVSQLGGYGVDINSLFSGAEGPGGEVPEAVEFGPDTNFTTIPASAFDNWVDLAVPLQRVSSLFPPTPWPGTIPPPAPPDVFDIAPGHLLWCGAPGIPIFDAPVNIQSGVKLTGLEFYGLDADPGAEIQAGLTSVCNTTPGNDLADFGPHNRLSITPGSGLAAMPGIVRLEGSALNHTVDNENCAYTAVVLMGCGSPISTAAFKVRIAWQRQITPPPATNTFGDVLTTDPFFREIEAMVAAGITGGCGGGLYCPDDTLTRAQMAAFLARGLGL
jgi:hypothetical protein